MSDTPVLTADELRESLYDQGQYADCLQGCETALQASPEIEERRNLWALMAWCWYRRDNLTGAKNRARDAEAEGAGHHTWALECLLAIAAKEQDDDELEAIAAQLGDTPVALNALIIRAMVSNDVLQLTVSDVFARTLAIEAHTDTPVRIGNVLNNAGFFTHGAGDDTEKLAGIGLIRAAIHHYGDTNWHHRAGAHYRLHLLYDALNMFEVALQELLLSAQLWDAALGRDPDNASYRRKRDSVRSECDRHRGISDD